MNELNGILDFINGYLWHDYVLYVVLGTGVLFTLWSGFSQYQALTHGTAVVRGKYDDKNDPGAINHFQALSTALSATVGLGNIAGVSIAIALGGPGAVFWMWIVGLLGMAIKTTEVTLSMLYRNTDDPENPHGGPMWVISQGMANWHPMLKPAGAVLGGIFCITLLISAVTGGNMFQSWNVAEITHQYFPSVPKVAVGIFLTVTVGLVIIGGIKRIGAVAGRLVPAMCAVYLLAAIFVVIVRIGDVPAMLRLIFTAAFSTTDAENAFLGGTMGYAFLWGMKRALFSSEAGQGSAPIAHSAAKTDEPVREGIVAGLEPFIDTLVVCTLTTLVILLSGAWNREAEVFLEEKPEVLLISDRIAEFDEPPALIEVAGDADVASRWTLRDTAPPPRLDDDSWAAGDEIFAMLTLEDMYNRGLQKQHAVSGTLVQQDGSLVIQWGDVTSDSPPIEVGTAVYLGATPLWSMTPSPLPAKSREVRDISGGPWKANNRVFMLVEAHQDPHTGRDLHALNGEVRETDDGALEVHWESKQDRAFTSAQEPRVHETGIYGQYLGAALTGHAFDRVWPGLGMWLVTIACWLFAISTIISWSYYGEQGVIYLVGERGVLTYKIIYCVLIFVATLDFVKSEKELDSFTTLGTGVMLCANIPIMLLLGYQAMRAYKDYIGRLKSGELDSHDAPSITDVVEGRDVE